MLALACVVATALGGDECKWKIRPGIAITHPPPYKVTYLDDASGCCFVAGKDFKMQAWMWNPPTPPVGRARRALTSAGAHTTADAPSPPVVFDKTTYHVKGSSLADLPRRSLIVLEGTVVADQGGNISIRSVNGTFADTTLAFGPKWAPHPSDPFFFMNLTMQTKDALHFGWATFMVPGKPAGTIEWYNVTYNPYSMLHIAAYLSLGGNPPPMPGRCSLYERVEQTAPAADNRTASGGPGFPGTSKGTSRKSRGVAVPYVSTPVTPSVE